MSDSSRRPLYKNPFLWAGLAGLIIIPLIRPLFRNQPPPPPVLLQLPDFELVDQGGRPFGSAQLRGKVYLVSFFYTACRSCDRLARAMQTLQRRHERWKSDVRLLSITVDPADTPEKLAAYAAAQGADLGRWTFLTGPEERIRRLIRAGFETHLGGKDGGGSKALAHGGRIGLVDQRGRLRGSYSSDAKGPDEAFHRSLHARHQKR